MLELKNLFFKQQPFFDWKNNHHKMDEILMHSFILEKNVSNEIVFLALKFLFFFESNEERKAFLGKRFRVGLWVFKHETFQPNLSTQCLSVDRSKQSKARYWQKSPFKSTFQVKMHLLGLRISTKLQIDSTGNTPRLLYVSLGLNISVYGIRKSTINKKKLI